MNPHQNRPLYVLLQMPLNEEVFDQILEQLEKMQRAVSMEQSYSADAVRPQNHPVAG